MKRFTILLLLVAASSAWASPGEQTVSIEAGTSLANIDGDGLAGGTFAGTYTRGLTERWWGFASGGGYIVGTPVEPMGYGVAGLQYVFDMVKWVPYGRVGAGAVIFSNAADNTKVRPFAQVQFGIDKLSRGTMSWGFFARASTGIGDPNTVTLGARLSWRWGFF